MDLTRTLRVLRARWPWVVVFAVLGFAAGVFGAAWRNASLTPVIRAEAPVTVVASVESEDNPSGVSRDFAQARLEEALAFALEVNADLLEANPSWEIFSDVDRGALVFVAEGSSTEEAQARAGELRSRYLEGQPPNVLEQIQTQLEQISARMADVRARIEAIGSPVAVDPDEEERAELQALLESLRADALEYQKELLVGSDRAEDEVQADLDRTTLAIATVNAQLDRLGPPPTVSEFSAEQTLRRALEREYEELEASFQELFLRQAALSGPVVSEVIDVVDQTPDPVSRGAAGAIGLLVGLVLAVAGLLVVDRLFKPVWTGADLAPLPLLAAVPIRKPSRRSIWYDAEEGGRRKRAVQGLRAGLQGRIGGLGAAVAVTGLGTQPEDVHALAADLAVAFARAGRSVLLVDADFTHDTNMVEYRGDVDFATLLEIPEGDDAALARILAQARPVRPNLISVQAGSPTEDPSELLARPLLADLIRVASARFDLVLFAANDLTVATAQELVQRVDYAVVTLVPGRVSRTELADRVADLEDRGAKFLGAVFVDRRGVMPAAGLGRGRPVAPAVAPREPAAEPARAPAPRPRRISTFEPAQADLGTLVEAVTDTEAPPGEVAEPTPEPEPTVEATAVPADADAETGDGQVVEPTVEPPAGGPIPPPTGTAAVDESVALELVERLAEAEPERAYPAVANFLVSRVENLLMSSPVAATEHGFSQIPDFLPLDEARGYRTVGSYLLAGLRAELGTKAAAELERHITRIIGAVGGGQAPTIDEWLVANFFRIHVATTERAPVIWHLASQRGAVNVFVYAPRFDRDALDHLAGDYVKAVIERLDRKQRAATKRNQAETAAALQEQIEEVRYFEISLGWLYEGTIDGARIYYPWRSANEQPLGWDPDWSEGIRPNLAPVQRLGLLAQPVLTDEELLALGPPMSHR